MDQMRIGPRVLGRGERPLSLADLGLRHGGDLGRARDMVRAALGAGAGGILLQAEREPGQDQHERFELSRAQFRNFWHWARDRFPEAALVLRAPEPLAESLIAELKPDALRIVPQPGADASVLAAACSASAPLLIHSERLPYGEAVKLVRALRREGVSSAWLHGATLGRRGGAQARLALLRRAARALGPLVGSVDHAEAAHPGLSLRTSLAVAAGALIVERPFTLDREGAGPEQSRASNPEDWAAFEHAISDALSVLGSERAMALPAPSRAAPAAAVAKAAAP